MYKTDPPSSLTTQTNGLCELVFLCPFHFMKYGRDPEVPPYVAVILVGEWIVDSGRVQNQKSYYGIPNDELSS